MWNHDYFSNVDDGLDYLETLDDGDGNYNFDQLYYMQNKFPVVVYPLFRLQVKGYVVCVGGYYVM